RPIPVEQQVYKTATPYVGEVDGKIVGTFVIMDMTCTRGAWAEWKTGGIAGVAVLPEARQTGVGNAMMRWSLRHMREQGYVLAALYAFRESYYRKFGYEVCGLRYKITCPTDRLPRHKAELPVRRIPYSDLGAIKPCYERFARSRSGMNLRQDLHWGRIITDDQVKTVYAAGDPVEAYAILEHDVDFWENQTIGEFAWTTMRGYESILSLFASVGINKTALTWYEPSDGPFLARHSDQGVKFESEKAIMFRAINFPKAVEQLGSTGQGEFSVGVDDPDVPENDGPWQICYSGSRMKVERSVGTDFRLDARSAVQVLLGQPSLDDLVRNGVVADCVPARRLLPAIPAFCTDYF
ncbi:MAG: enhanced intracellular survival protein Eis, partial [Fimbriimonadales bacterium]